MSVNFLCSKHLHVSKYFNIRVNIYNMYRHLENLEICNQPYRKIIRMSICRLKMWSDFEAPSVYTLTTRVSSLSSCFHTKLCT